VIAHKNNKDGLSNFMVKKWGFRASRSF